MTTPHTRRDFLRLACCSAATASIVGGLSKFGLVSALAQGSTDYKALVCIFLFGGNDSNNLLVPLGSAYPTYQSIRANLAIAQASLLPLQIAGQANFGFHPNLIELQGFFNNQKISRCLPTLAPWFNPPRKHSTKNIKIFLRIFFLTPTSRTSGKPRN